MRELLSIEEVAERLRVKVLTIRWLRQEGRFPPAIKVGRRLRWDAADLEAWLETQRVGGGSVSVQRIVRGETLRYRARVKSHGREVATRVFERKRDAVAWEQEQRRELRSGEWFDPRRARIALSALYPEWSQSRSALKRETREADESAWRNHIQRGSATRPSPRSPGHK